jgi:ADP-heptose:LPS heptosyltransferase
MKILILQLKRIGDLILTTPALTAIKAAQPDAHVALAVHTSTASLLPAIRDYDSAVIFGPGRGWTPWQQVLTGRFDVVLDLTGTDRSALATFCARAHRRITFEWVKRKRLRALVYNEFVASSVRERHTVDHYLDLTSALATARGESSDSALPHLHVAAAGASGGYVVIHPGTARPEKNWLNERWAVVVRRIVETHGTPVKITTGPDPLERASAEALRDEISDAAVSVVQPNGLAEFATTIAGARMVASCDTAAVHLAAAFQRPQLALFGPTNPFHWRPRHPQGVVISAARADAPLTQFDPRMKGAPMERISTDVVCRAIDDLLRAPPASPKTISPTS